MANYVIDPGILIPYLPNGVEPDVFGSKTYVSLVGFMFKKTKLFDIPIPFLGTFEEINLRFYVKRLDVGKVKRGVVFINETVPFRPVAWLANKLYKEHYMAIPTKSLILSHESGNYMKYEWKINEEWNHIEVNASKENGQMPPGSFEEFIFEHYYGYTRLNNMRSQEYEVIHPRWNINTVVDYSIRCDFSSMYGSDFSVLSDQQPDSVILALGSPVSVKWKRTVF